MITLDQIEKAIAILVQEAQPDKVILFGSYARGDAGPGSDLDLLVVEKELTHPRREMVRLRCALSPLRIPVDILVTDTKRLSSSWADFPGSYLYHALREGKVLYAVDRTSAPAAS